MAIGGALRAAIKAGRFGAAARESRQRARALRSLNRTGGVGNFQRRLPLEERGFERMSGFGYGETPRGNALVNNTFTGTRTVMPQGLDDYMFARPLPRSPIEAPYEGFRVLPEGGRYDARYGEYMGRGVPGPWMGRGRGTEWMELPFDGGPPYVNGTYFEQFPGPRPLGGPFDTRTDRPLFPWQMFADTGVPTPTRSIPSMFPTRYSFDDITGQYSFVDPQTGFRYGLNGFPLD